VEQDKNLEVGYPLSMESFVSFLKGRTVIGEIENQETPDGPGWGLEFGSTDSPAKALFVSRWGADEEELPSVSGAVPQVGKKPRIWIYEKPQYRHDDCPGCSFLGSYHYFDKMTCEFRKTDLYMCDNKVSGILHSNRSPCPTFLVRLGPGEGNYCYANSYNHIALDPMYKEALSRAKARELFVETNYPEVFGDPSSPEQVQYFTGGGNLQFTVGANNILYAGGAGVLVEEDNEYDEDGNLIDY